MPVLMAADYEFATCCKWEAMELELMIVLCLLRAARARGQWSRHRLRAAPSGRKGAMLLTGAMAKHHTAGAWRNVLQ